MGEGERERGYKEMWVVELVDTFCFNGLRNGLS